MVNRTCTLVLLSMLLVGSSSMVSATARGNSAPSRKLQQWWQRPSPSPPPPAVVVADEPTDVFVDAAEAATLAVVKNILGRAPELTLDGMEVALQNLQLPTLQELIDRIDFTMPTVDETNRTPIINALRNQIAEAQVVMSQLTLDVQEWTEQDAQEWLTTFRDFVDTSDAANGNTIMAWWIRRMFDPTMDIMTTTVDQFSDRIQTLDLAALSPLTGLDNLLRNLQSGILGFEESRQVQVATAPIAIE